MNIVKKNNASINTKSQSAYEKYCRIYVPYEYRKVTEILSKNSNFVIIEQVKGSVDITVE